MLQTLAAYLIVAAAVAWLLRRMLVPARRKQSDEGPGTAGCSGGACACSDCPIAGLRPDSGGKRALPSEAEHRDQGRAKRPGQEPIALRIRTSRPTDPTER